MSASLASKIKSRKATIAVVGLGYVGLPLAVSFARKGFRVFGIDKDKGRVDRIENKQSYITDLPTKELAAVVNNGKFSAGVDSSVLGQADAIIICVPTPLRRKYTPDISYIVSAVKDVANNLKKGQLIVLESTTYPGTTEEMIKPVLEKGNYKLGRDFYAAFSPERIDPGNKHYDVTRIPKLVGGLTPVCGELTKLLYNQIIKEVHLLSSARAAEMTKLLENSFRIINIGWINEVAMMCHKLNIDVWEVIDAAKTKPFGFMAFYPGLGVGGHCIPDDPLYLYWKAKQYGFSSKYIKLSADTNTNMPAYAIKCLASIMHTRKKSLKGAKLLVLGATYKKDVKDLRKSPSLALIDQLQQAKAVVDYHDPIVPYLAIENINMNSVPLTKENIKKYDCVIITVDHTKVDYDLIAKHAKLVFDIKNIYKGKAAKNIVRF
jgi:UDP-N-acetyl-D-glucosamine dehydrogenase